MDGPKVLELNVQEVQALVQLLDLALKAGGLQVIGNVGHFIEKLNAPPAVAG